MELMQFQKLRGGLRINVSPAQGDTLEAVGARLRSLLMSSTIFGNVEVEITDNPDTLVIGLVNYRRELSEQDIVNYLEKAWTDELRYLGWDAHAFLVEDGHVELQAATMHGDASHFVTLHVVATAGATSGAIPSQRTSATNWASGFRPRRWRREKRT
jgi:hypothetical protein